MNRTTQLALYLASCGVLLWMAWITVTSFSAGHKIAFVDLQSLYRQYGLTTELDHKLSSIYNETRYKVDSLKLARQSLQDRLMEADSGKAGLPEMIHQLSIRIQTIERDNQDRLNKLKDNYQEQIWRQLNQYLNDFGQERNYKFIFGASGEGNIMYADVETANITEEVLEFINHKYEDQ